MAGRTGDRPVGPPPESNVAAPVGASRHQNRAGGSNSPRWPPRWPPHELAPWLVLVASLLPFVYVAGALASDFLEGDAPPRLESHQGGGAFHREVGAPLSGALTRGDPRRASAPPGVADPRYRRTFGLLAFFYACTHLIIYAVLDVELTWSDMVEDVAKRLYITIGMTALVLLIPLAITSTKGWIRRMGNTRWTALHRLVYVSAVLGLVHSGCRSEDVAEPALFGLVFAVLLGWRLWRWRTQC